MIWYEPSTNLHEELPALVEYEARVAEEDAAAAMEEEEEAELEGLEEDESMPAP